MEPAATPFGGTDPRDHGSFPCILPVFQIHMLLLGVPLLPSAPSTPILRLFVRPHLPSPSASRVAKRRSSWLGSFPSLPSVVNFTTQGETGAEKGSGRLDPTGVVPVGDPGCGEYTPSSCTRVRFGPCQGIQPTSFHPTWEEQARKRDASGAMGRLATPSSAAQECAQGGGEGRMDACSCVGLVRSGETQRPHPNVG